MDKLKKFNKRLSQFNTGMLKVIGVIYLIGSILWVVAKFLGK